MRNLLLDAVPASARRAVAAARRRLGSEQGFAVPTVMLMTVAALGMAGVAVMTSVQGQSGTVRDQGSKAALSVAESGVSQALLHYNRGVPPCVAPTEGEWCGPVTGMSVNGGQVSYWARVLDGEACDIVDVGKCVDIVSQGTVDGVTRRVEVFASSMDDEGGPGGGPFTAASVLSRDTLTLDSNAIIHTGSATNGDIDLSGNAKQCGPASVGIGKEMKHAANTEYTSDPLCKSPASSYGKKELILPPVPPESVPAEADTDNHRFFALDNVTGGKNDACWNGVNANGKASKNCGPRELYIGGAKTTVTLTGSIYSFCRLMLRSNSTLQVAPGANVTIYFDSPEKCGYSSGVNQLEMDSNTLIKPTTGDPITITMLFVGSEKLDTNIVLSSNTSVDEACDQNFVIYAPLTDIKLRSNSSVCGAVAGESVHLEQNAEIWSGSGTEEFNLPGVSIPPTPDHYMPYRFVECTGVATASPNVGC
jgi:hypothetical protein